MVFTIAFFGLAINASCCDDFEVGVVGAFGSGARWNWLVGVALRDGLSDLLELHLSAGRRCCAPDVQAHARNIFGEDFVQSGAGVVGHLDVVEEV